MKQNIYLNIVFFQCLDNIEHQTNDLYLTRCGIQKCPPNHKWGPKKRPQYHMHFILDGEGYLKIDQETYHLKADQIFLIPPNTSAHYYADSQNPWSYAFISFQGNKAKQYDRQAGFDTGQYIRDCVLPTEKFAAIVQEMLDTHQLTITNELRRVGLLFTLFSLLTESYSTSASVSHKRHEYLPETYLEHALQYIQLNYSQNIHIQDIADYIGITRSYLFHLFNKNLKMSPQQYLLNYRIKKHKSFWLPLIFLLKRLPILSDTETLLHFPKSSTKQPGFPRQNTESNSARFLMSRKFFLLIDVREQYFSMFLGTTCLLLISKFFLSV